MYGVHLYPTWTTEVNNEESLIWHSQIELIINKYINRHFNTVHKAKEQWHMWDLKYICKKKLKSVDILVNEKANKSLC